MRIGSGIKKFTLCMAACMILALGLTGCGGDSKKTPTDAVAPTGTSSLSTTAVTKGSVTITVTASDNSSGVASIKLPDNSVVTTATATYTVSANGTYSFVLTDKAGNAATLPVTVSNIDTAAPTATSSLSTIGSTDGPVTITVTASDNLSGVQSITLPDSTVVTASTATYTVSADGTYSFILTDKVGNTATVPVTVSNIAVLADNAIQSVTTTGFVDVDGAKIQAIAIKYNLELKGSAIDASTFEIWDYALGKAIEMGSNPGVYKNAYIDNEPYDTDGQKGSGNYVVIEVNTDYQLASVPVYQVSMAAGVKQLESFTNAVGTRVNASATEFTNYKVVQGVDRNGNPTYTNTAIAGKFSITNIKDFQLFSNDSADVLGYTPNGAAFHATNCFDELDGLLHDVDLPYALYVPADYDPAKKYMLVLHVEDAGALGTDPMITLTEAKANANYASPEVQQLAKDKGYAGLIVVAPQIPAPLRSTRDNYSMSAAVPATWQLVDYIIENYSIDADHIYASGQSMGGMQVVAMAAQRDNFFAAVWPIGSQWGSNNNLEVPFADRAPAAPYYTSNDATIWTVDAHGNAIDASVQRNWYYMVSDDNILIDDCLGDAFSPTVWKEAATLYKDITGGVIDIKGKRFVSFSPFASSDDQNAAVLSLMAQTDFSNPDFGMMWEAYNGGSHMVTWVYAHRIFANYQWLLSQSRQTEMARAKLDLNKPFVAAATQLTDADHLIFTGQTYYYKTAAKGSGTAGYNTGFYNPNGQVVRLPGWTPDNY